MKIYCQICNKSYKTYNSLYVHRRRYHPSIDTLDSKCNKCSKCGCEFDRLCNLVNHKKTCSLDSDLIVLQSELEKKLEPDLYEKVIDRLHKQSEYKIINKHQSNNVNQQQNIQILGVNNIDNSNKCNIKIIGLGNENLSEILNAKEQINILNKRCQALEEIIKYVHFNDKYPQFHNVAITDLKSGNGLQFDESSGDYMVVKRTDMLNNIIENRMDDIADFLDNNKDKLGKTTKISITNFINKIVGEAEDPNSQFIKDKRKYIELLMYNNRKKVLKLKKSNKIEDRLEIL
jgi:hypothetical protein